MKVRRKVIYSVFDLWLNSFDMGKLMKEFGKISERKKNHSVMYQEKNWSTKFRRVNSIWTEYVFYAYSVLCA